MKICTENGFQFYNIHIKIEWANTKKRIINLCCIIFFYDCKVELLVAFCMSSKRSLASLPTTPRYVVWSTHQKEGMPPRETWKSLRGGSMQTSQSSTRPSERFCTWVRAIPSTNRGWAGNGLRADLRRRT